MSSDFYVYILASRSGVLYVGVTNDLERRVWQHKHHVVPGFTDHYNVTRLVYFEATSSIRSAIEREKQIKRWRREKKERLIATTNPQWRDLAESWWNEERLECAGRDEGDPSTPRPPGPLRSG